MSEVLQTKVLYDDRFGHYHNLFTESKVVHKPFLYDYLKEIINDENVIHIIVVDSKDENNKSYLSEVKELLNQDNVVPHIISPRSYYKLPKCKYIHYYLELDKGPTARIKKLSTLIDSEDRSDRIMINVVQDIHSIMLQYQTPSGSKM